MAIGACTYRQSHHRGHPRQAVREVQQEPQRWLIGPLGVVDGKDQRAALRQVHDEPVEAVQGRERDVAGLLGCGHVAEHRLGQPRGTGQ